MTMATTSFNSITHVAHKGTPDDKVWLRKIGGLCCHKCTDKPGPAKRFQHMWAWHYHVLWHHPLENVQEIETQIVNLIKLGILK